MQYDEDFLDSEFGYSIPYRAWRCRRPVATVLFVHGMAEHAGRYAEFGEALTDQNINLVAFDLPGHGEHCDEHLIGKPSGWDTLIETVLCMHAQSLAWEPDAPIFLMGHSLGAVICLDLLTRYPTLPLAGAVISGIGFARQFELKQGLLVAKFERWRLGAQGNSTLLNTLSFKKWNKGFRPNHSEFDWLSRNVDAVNGYIEDPYCGFQVSNQLWIDALEANLRFIAADGLSSIKNALPMLIAAGEQDPVSRFGEGTKQLVEALVGDNMTDVSLKLYPGARHELLFENNKSDVMADYAAWITARIPTAVAAE